MVMAILDVGPLELAAARFASRAGAAQEAAVLAALQLLHTALDLDEAVPGVPSEPPAPVAQTLQVPGAGGARGWVQRAACIPWSSLHPGPQVWGRTRLGAGPCGWVLSGTPPGAAA